jgi:hypothetical protein
VGSLSTPQDENSSHPIRLSLAGCSPAEPVSVSPDENIISNGSFFVKPRLSIFYCLVAGYRANVSTYQRINVSTCQRDNVIM